MKETRIAFYSDRAIIERGKKKNTSYLISAVKVLCVNTTQPQVDSCHNIIKVAYDVYAEIQSKYCLLANPQNGKFSDVIIVVDDTIADLQIKITGYLARKLGIKKNEEVYICKELFNEFSTVKLQTLSNIYEDNIILSAHDAKEKLLCDLHSFSLIEVMNSETTDCFYIKPKHIKIDPSLNNGVIRLSRKQRKILSDNIPSRLTCSQWNKIQEYIAGVSNSARAYNIRKTLFRIYANEGNRYVLKKTVEQITYEQREMVQQTIQQALEIKIIIRPVIESFSQKPCKNILRCLSNFFVGKSTMSLVCRRPYENDETSNIVRISKENMKRLGILEMEKVIIQHKEKCASCRVLAFDNEDYFYSTNLYTPIDLSIGIPAHLRKKLDIIDIQSAVKVDRDTTFLLLKSSNEQVVPVLLAFFSLSIFNGLSLFLQFLITFAAIPFIIYINLSSRRNMKI